MACVFLQTAQADEVLVVGNESMPFNATVDAKNVGIAVEILQTASTYGAPEFRFELNTPWKRAQQLLHEAGKKPTAIIPFTRTPKREHLHTWIAPLFKYQTRISTTDQQTDLTLDDFLHKDIGIIRASAHLPLLKKLGFTNIVKTNNARQSAMMLNQGRLAAIAESQYVDTYYWKQQGLNPRILQFIPIGEVKQIYIAGNLEFPPETAIRIAAAIDKMNKQGIVQTIVKQWAE